MCNNCQEWASLHTHSEGSPDGMGTVKNLTSQAKQMGFNAIGITEHGSLSTAISFVHNCKTQNIKPIMGMEAYVEVDGVTCHLTLLADGNEGFDNLIKLNNIGKRGNRKQRAFPLPALEKHNRGIVVLTGCPASPMQIERVDYNDAKKTVGYLKRIFGDQLFAELMFIGHGVSGKSWERTEQIARDFDLPLVLTNDVHYIHKGDSDIHNILTRIKMGGFDYPSDELYLASTSDLRDRVRSVSPSHLPLLEKGMKNSLILANNLGSVSFDSTPKLPHIPNAHLLLENTALDLFEKMTFETDAKRDEAEERLLRELNIVTKKGYPAYFLIVRELVQVARDNNVRVGPGRGSAAGSFLSYVLGITEINPLDYGLIFERFLNIDREALPDIDTDFSSVAREKVIEYASKKYGAVPIATYSTWSHKSLVNDLCKNFGINKDDQQEAAEFGVDSDAFRRISLNHPDFKRAYDAMIGQTRHMSKHAGGIIITDGEVPLENKGGNLLAAWTEGGEAELSKAGIVKIDLLGLDALDVLQGLEETLGVPAPWPDDSNKNDPVYDLFCEGKTLGIFQFSGSDGIIEMCKAVQPKSITDLAAINALYRPGPLDSGTAWLYPELGGKPRNLHPFIDDILEPTRGIIAFQEQFMTIYARVTGKTLEQADNARRAIVKYKPGNPESEQRLLEVKEEFLEGCDNNGISHAKAKKIWGEIQTHTGYSFNKSHSVAYSVLAYQMAWFKYYYPVHFYAEILNAFPDKVQAYMFEIIAEGIEIKRPDINKSSDRYTSDGTYIYMPLTVVKYLGENSVRSIMDIRPFSSYKDFMKRTTKSMVKSRAREGLYYVGAFDDFTDDPSVLDVRLDNTEPIDVKYMGFVIPTIDKMRLIQDEINAGNTAGMVVDTEHKTSKYGPYVVYKIEPGKNVWSRRVTNIPKGAWIVAKYTKTSGKIRDEKGSWRFIDE